MALIDRTSEQIADYGTGVHADETLAARSALVPPQLMWSDLHPPGVKVLPRGSGPAGSGEINWEDTLGGQFALALARLEALLYAVFGSRPGAYYLSGTWRKCQWYDRPHPRCLWGPEMWVPICIAGPEGCYYGEGHCNGQCWDYAFGESPGGLFDVKEVVAGGGYYAELADAFPRPQVPIRSRSGDPAYQCRVGTHLRRFFPRDCLVRTAGSTFPFDPIGYGWFGATDPGRDDAGSNPFLHDGDGYTWEEGQDVTISYTLPAGAMVPTHVKLHYQIKPRDGSWGAWQEAAMSEDGGVYSATIDAQQHRSECRWYIEYYYHIASKPGELVERSAADVGVIELGAGHGLTDRDELDVSWDGGTRYGMAVVAYDATTVTVAGGAGDALPAPAVGETGAVVHERLADDEAILTVAPGHGLTLQNLLDLDWSGGSRDGLRVTAYTATTVTVQGGTGDPLPGATTNVTYSYESPVAVSREVTYCDPGGASPPDAEDAYSFVWYAHYNPFGRGLPEMLDESWYGQDIRHGTDYYEFDGSERVQPELINLARLALSWLGGTACSEMQDNGCRQTYGQPIYHSPRLRPDDAECCLPMPVRFRWSGSNKHPHYLRGGKGDPADWDPLDTRPLIDILPPGEDEETYPTGSAPARQSWRGMDAIFGEAPFSGAGNPYYGDGASWDPPPPEFQLKLDTAWEDDARIYAEFGQVGLRVGDVTDPVHIQEIIDAVDYLIDYGVWGPCPIKSCKKAPPSIVGHPCGYWEMEYDVNPEAVIPGYDYYQHFIYTYPCLGCCGPTSECGYGWQNYYTYWELHKWEDPPGTPQQATYSGEINIYDQHCDDFPAPDWEDCWNQEGDCTPGTCYFGASRNVECRGSSDSGFTYKKWNLCTGCPNVPTGSFCSPIGAIGCGSADKSRCCECWNAISEEYESCTDGESGCTYCTGGCDERIGGLSHRVCTPPACGENGWDDDHGSIYVKQRFDHTWHPGIYAKATGPPGNEASGNCWGDIYVCGTLASAEHLEIWFEEVRAVTWLGLALPWWDQCDCDGGGCPFGLAESLADPPELPGYGVHTLDGEALCYKYRRDPPEGWPQTCDGRQCACDVFDFSVCAGESAWCAVDLNLDDEGVPYRTYNGRDHELNPYDGLGIPHLRDYDLTKDPTTWMHDCPCETWTGAGECEV